MSRNRFSIRPLLGPLTMALSVVVIVAGTLEWPVGLCYGLFALMVAMALAAGRAERRSR